MASRRKSTPAPSSKPQEFWEELRPFRETFMRHLRGTPQGAALETLGAFFFEMLLDWLHLPQDNRAPVILEELEAVVIDLQHLRGFLRREVAKSTGSLEDDSRERWLTAKADEWADSLAEVADEIQMAIAN